VSREAQTMGALDAGDCVRTGLAFGGSSYAFRIALDLGTSVALARMLAPADFGIVAVAATFLQVSYVVGNMGMSGAVIQATALSENDRHAAYIISGLSGLLLTGLGIVAGPWAAGFFSMPVLRAALPVMSAQMFLSGLSAVPMALLRRQLLWGRVAVVDIVSGVLYSFVSIGMAARRLWRLEPGLAADCLRAVRPDCAPCHDPLPASLRTRPRRGSPIDGFRRHAHGKETSSSTLVGTPTISLSPGRSAVPPQGCTRRPSASARSPNNASCRCSMACVFRCSAGSRVRTTCSATGT